MNFYNLKKEKNKQKILKMIVLLVLKNLNIIQNFSFFELVNF